MLILNPQIGESLIIGDDIMIVILDHKNGHGKHARLGIEAPKDIKVNKGDRYKKIGLEED